MNLQKRKKSTNHAEIMRINRQIEALERQRGKLFDEDSKLEREAKEKAWKDENEDAISFCKKLVGKAFTFGPKVIKHHNPFDEPPGYDYVNVYFPLCIDYVDKYNVHLYCRQMVNDDHAARLTDRHSMTLRVSYLDGTYKPSEHEIYSGAAHILTDDELKIAFDFWLKKANDLFANEFTKNTKKPWECSFNPDKYLMFNTKKEEKKAKDAEEEKFLKERDAILSARKVYYRLLNDSEYGGILRAENEHNW